MREHRHAQAILKEAVEMAGHYDIKIKTVVRSRVPPDGAILTEAKKGNHDIIVMSVKRRLGDTLFFGDTAAAVLAKSPCPFLFLSS
jgi:nucleotide-binding universal stress UspA family protein